MGSNILNIGQSGLNAAQVGMSVTGNNIANAATPGYTRQVVVQGAAQSQNFGFGYLGQGTKIDSIERMYNELNHRQVMQSQASASEINTYSAQIQRLNNLLADPDVGITNVTSNFFSSVQNLTTNPNNAAAKQAMLSASNALAQRFQSIDGQLKQINQDVNTEMINSISNINVYAKQIGKLNDAIEKAISANGNAPNDLLDQRDQLINDLNKEIKTTVVADSGGKYNVFIGNGLPLVVGTQAYTLSPGNSTSNGNQLEINYITQNGSATLSPDSLPGGRLGGLLQFRNETLNQIKTEFGHIANSITYQFNMQHRAGLDANSNPGSAYFNETSAIIIANANNTGNATIGAQIADINETVASDYRIKYDGTNYIVTRTSDQLVRNFTSLPQTVDGLTIQMNSGSFLNGDDYLIQPNANAAASFKVAINNINQIAIGAPTVNSVINSTGSLEVLGLTNQYNNASLSPAISLAYDAGSNSLSGFPAALSVTVKQGNNSVTYPPGSNVPYSPGATIQVGGVQFKLTGSLTNGDSFNLSQNTTNAPGDNRNGLKLGALRAANVMQSGSTTFEGTFAQMVSKVGSKTAELRIMGIAENRMLEQAILNQQSVSGVNLDEEATNLLRYQQAFQASSKMMQIASQMFETLLQLG